MEKDQELQKLKNQREKQITGIFWFGLEIAIIFAVPAIFAALIGKKLIGGGVWLIFLMTVAFIFSWTVMGLRYKRLNKRMKKLDDKIFSLQKEIENK